LEIAPKLRRVFGPALDRAFAHDGLSVVNVLTDPADAYPRSSNLG
jgi:acetolactate synthase-1/2/3 large subunit